MIIITLRPVLTPNEAQVFNGGDHSITITMRPALLAGDVGVYSQSDAVNLVGVNPVLTPATAALTLATFAPSLPSKTTVYPNADGSIGDWTDETGVGTTDLWSHVDEPTASPNDADYITASTISTITSVFLLLQDMPGDFGSMGSTIVVKVATS